MGHPLRKVVGSSHQIVVPQPSGLCSASVPPSASTRSVLVESMAETLTVDRDFAPGFPLRHAAKDAELALHAADQHAVHLPLTDALLPRWRAAIANSHGGDDVASAVTAAVNAIGVA